MADFIPLSTNAQFYDPAAMAQLATDQQQLAQRQQLAQAFLSGGYVPNSGKAGVLGSLLSAITGGVLQHQNNERVSDVLKRTFEQQNQAAQAKRAQEIADEQRKMQEEIYKGITVAQGTAKAKKDFAAPQFTGGGVFDPSQGSFAPNQDWMNQQLALKGAEAKIAAANRAPPEIYAKMALAKQMGATPDQLKAMLLGGDQSGLPVTVTQPNSGVQGADYLKTLDPNTANQIKALAEGRMNFPTGSALRSPYWQALLQGVSNYDPSFEAANYNARSKTRNDFTSGKSAQTINALNTVEGHLGDLSDAAKNLDNFGGVLTPLNSIKNAAASTFGDPRVKQFEANRQAAVAELTRVYRGTGGSEGDLKQWTDALSTSNSPEQLQKTIGQITGLLNSKISALGDQYKQGMGTIAGQKDFISPTARAALQRVEKRSGISLDDGASIGGQEAAQGSQVAPQTKTIGGQTFVNINGQWFAQ